MSLPIPTIVDLQGLRTGLFFGETTSPTLAEAEALLQESALEVARIFYQLGLGEEAEGWTQQDYPELAAWHERIILYRAMAEVMRRQRGVGENEYLKAYTRERQLALKSPSAVGIPIPEDLEKSYAGAPTNSVQELGLKDKQLSDAYFDYFRKPGGF